MKIILAGIASFYSAYAENGAHWMPITESWMDIII